ncbi:hypothetical protein OsI_07727 [Oryza sativa Indica Group]|uniref:Uncharacterized protein n=1 Tax=Oryza sativa subsp. indica TaxID=39946 RepID=B8AEC7_ORYSI|nr:hypothetical protein OsI_07727 [Oryza sativa Indica Group]
MAVGDDGLVVDSRMSGQRGGSVATKAVGSIAGAKSCWRWGRRQDDGEELRRRDEEIEVLIFPLFPPATAEGRAEEAHDGHGGPPPRGGRRRRRTTAAVIPRADPAAAALSPRGSGNDDPPLRRYGERPASPATMTTSTMMARVDAAG